jgi:DNA-binding MarR family transcriptional regulator
MNTSLFQCEAQRESISNTTENLLVRSTDLFTELVRLEIELWNDLDTTLQREAGITLAQYQALTAIVTTNRGARVQEISVEMSITVGATSKVVDRLERDGLAVRAANPDDRRSSIVTLTEHGVSSHSSADHAAETHLRQVFGHTLSDDRAASLLEELRLLRTSTRKAAVR